SIGRGSVIDGSEITHTIVGSGATITRSKLSNSLVGDDTIIDGLVGEVTLGDNSEVRVST
ncbi:MAG: hypothetical protein ABIZ36_00840, partial [Gemmatimonadaceae bacterium]